MRNITGRHAEGEELVGPHDVEVLNETLVLIGCDTEVGKEAIQAGMTARVIGKLVRIDNTDVLRSVVVFLQAREVSGQITLIEDEIDGKIVTVEQETGVEVGVFGPSVHPLTSREMVSYRRNFSVRDDKFAYSSIQTPWTP